MKITTDESNDDMKEYVPAENKIDENSQHSSDNLNKNNKNNIYKLIVNDDYYSITQNLNKMLKSYHKSLMQNIGKLNKNLLNNNIINKNNVNINNNINDNNTFPNESTEKDLANINNLIITILNQIELIHNNFYLNSKKKLLKMNKNYNKRKKN